MVDFFGKAEVVKAPKKGAAKKDEDFKVVEGLEEYAVIDTAIKTLTSLLDVAGGVVREQMRKTFIATAVATHRKPSSYKGIEGAATASLEIRKRSTNSKLDETQVEILDDLGIPYDTVADRPETFIINPKYKDDAALLGQVSEALNCIEGIPADFMLRQEATTKNVVNEDTEAAVYKLDEDQLTELLDVVAVLAIKAKLDPGAMPAKEVFQRLGALVANQ